MPPNYTVSSKFLRIITSSPAIVIIALLATSLVGGCASTDPKKQIFDFAAQPPPNLASTTIGAETRGKTEMPGKQRATALLGALRLGAGYKVREDVSSNGRYNIYMFETGYGTYEVTSDALARKHVREIIALNELKQRSKGREFAHGVGDAVTSPFRAVYTTVTDPGGAATAAYSNTRRMIGSVGRGISKAGEFIVTGGKPKKSQPDRESDSMIGGFIGIPEAKRRLAAALKVDPYTHFKPLANELDKVASYSAAGKFGVNTAVGFVSGGAGTAISGLKTFDSLTEQTLSLAPDEATAVNRERLEKLGLAKGTIETLLLNDKLTPTEKTQAVGYLNSLAGTRGLGDLVSFVGTSNSRHEAYAALQALAYLSGHPFGSDRIAKVEVIDHIPIVAVRARQIAILTSDYFAWTQGNAEQFSRLGNKLGGDGKAGTAKEMRISGKVSALARRELQRRGWNVQSNSFDSLLDPVETGPAPTKSMPQSAKAAR
ncbi:hypothetical protein [Labrys neptuniae]